MPHEGRATTPDTLQEDVIRVCEEIHDRARRRGWNMQKLAGAAKHSFQSFVNWKKGHQLPKIEALQDFARATGANVRLILQDAFASGTVNAVSHNATGGVVDNSLERQLLTALHDLSPELQQDVLDFAERHRARWMRANPHEPAGDISAPPPRRK